MQPPPHVPTVLRMLRCTSPEAESSVMNYLIDQARIEQLALADSIQDARSLAQHQRVASAYTSDGQRAYKRKNTLTTEPVPMWLRNGYRAPRLSAAEGTTGREAAQDLEKRLADARQRVIDLRAAVMVSQAAYEEAREVAKRYRLELCEASRHCMMTQADVDDLMSQIPPEVAATQADGSLGDAQTAEEIIQATQAVIDFEEQLDEARTELAAAEAKESEAHAALETAKQTMEQLAAENAELLDSFAAEMAEEEKARALAETYRTELAALQETRGHLERQLQETREQAMEITMVAEMVCAREDGAAAKQEVEQALLADGKSRREGFMESFFTCAVLNQKIDRLRKKIADAEREAGGSLEMIQGELDAQLAERRHKGAEQRNALEMHKAFRESLKQRKRKLQEIDQLTESTVNSRFNDYMKRKGHVGRVQLHREQQRLTLSVRIGERAGEGSGAVKDLKQLSGGERSYTTVAFTLALRGETESPFVAMDEVDVFMDNVNRRVAMENLFSFAREQAELQMVVLSPLSVDVIADVQRSTQWPKEFIKVVQMQPARE
jgi:structural maintenance of chromosomes protein 6